MITWIINRKFHAKSKTTVIFLSFLRLQGLRPSLKKIYKTLA